MNRKETDARESVIYSDDVLIEEVGGDSGCGATVRCPECKRAVFVVEHGWGFRSECDCGRTWMLKISAVGTLKKENKK